MSDSASMTGHLVRTVAVRVEDVEVPAGVRLAGHGHDAPHLCFLMDGEFEERHLGRWRTMSPGTLRSSPAGDEHDLVFRARSRCLLVFIHGAPGGITPQLPAERRFHSAPRIQSLAQAVSRSLTRPRDASPLALEAQVLELLAAALLPQRRRGAAVPPRWLTRVRDRIHDQPEKPPSAAALAADTDLHPVYIARAFRRHYGMGLGEYARLTRAEYARGLLARTTTPLAEVAAVAGYSDQSHLSRSMRQLLDCTPGDLRRRQGHFVQVASIQDTRRAAS
jgi:AraC family transcriptional regulator